MSIETLSWVIFETKIQKKIKEPRKVFKNTEKKFKMESFLLLFNILRYILYMRTNEMERK